MALEWVKLDSGATWGKDCPIQHKRGDYMSMRHALLTIKTEIEHWLYVSDLDKLTKVEITITREDE